MEQLMSDWKLSNDVQIPPAVSLHVVVRCADSLLTIATSNDPARTARAENGMVDPDPLLA